MTRQRNPPQDVGGTARHAPPQSVDMITSHVGRQTVLDLCDVDSKADPSRGAIDILSDMMSLIRLRLGLIGAVAFGLSLTICLYAYTQPSVFQSSAEVNLLPAGNPSNVAAGSRSDSRSAAHVTGQMRFLVSSQLIGRFIDSGQVSDLTESWGTGRSIPHVMRQVVGGVATIASTVVQKVAQHAGIGTRLHREEAGPAGNLGEEAVGSSATILHRNGLIEAFTKALTVNTSAGLSRDSGIVEVSFRAYRQEVAQRTLQEYLDFYGQVTRDHLRADLEVRRTALKERLAKAEQTLMQSDITLAAFVEAHGILPWGNNELGPALNLVNKSVERIVEAREEKERVRSQSGPDMVSTTTVLGKTGDEEFLAELNRQLAGLEAQYAEQTTFYSKSFPKMIQLQRRIDHVRERVAAITKKTQAAALESAAREEKVREHTLDETRKDAARVNSLQVRYAGLRRKVETDNQVCQKLLSALEDVDIQSAAIPAGVSIIEPPSLSPLPVAPRRGLIAAVGIVLGLLCGVAVASVAESLASSRRVLDLQKTASDIDTRPLGIVPDFATFEGMGRSKNQFNTSPLFPRDDSGRPVSYIIRDIETSLYFFPAGEQSKVAMVSSAIACEGKTFLAASLACAMSSREGQRTLVLDADMRRPRLHKVFGDEALGAGLSTALTERNPDLSRMIHRSHIPGLFYLTAGPVPDDPLALLRSKRFPQVLNALERYFDNIVIDSPPVLSVPDYMPLCHVVKQVILVVKQGKTLREEVRKCADLIRCVSGTHILGVILNRAQSSAGRYSSAEHHHSRYHYRYHERYYREAS